MYVEWISPGQVSHLVRLGHKLETKTVVQGTPEIKGFDWHVFPPVSPVGPLVFIIPEPSARRKNAKCHKTSMKKQ